MQHTPDFTSPASFVIPAARRCLYKSKVCPFPRDAKANGEMHRLCSLHRSRANENQRRWLKRRRTSCSHNSSNEGRDFPSGKRTCMNRGFGENGDFESLWAGCGLAHGSCAWTPIFARPMAANWGSPTGFPAIQPTAMYHQWLLGKFDANGDQLALTDGKDSMAWALQLALDLDLPLDSAPSSR